MPALAALIVLENTRAAPAPPEAVVSNVVTLLKTEGLFNVRGLLIVMMPFFVEIFAATRMPAAPVTEIAPGGVVAPITPPNVTLFVPAVNVRVWVPAVVASTVSEKVSAALFDVIVLEPVNVTGMGKVNGLAPDTVILLPI